MIKESILPQIGYNILIYQELSEVLLAFRKTDIPVIVLKGAALAETVYRHIGLRTMSDVDLLVKQEDLLDAQERLVELGYKLQPGSHLFYTKDCSFPMAIDLHWDIWSRSNANPQDKIIDMVWKEARPVEIAGVNTLVMSPEDTLIYIAVHLAVYHGLPLKKWVKDIDAVVRYYVEKIDWDKVIQRTKVYQVQIPVYYTFRVVKERLGAPIPEIVFDKLKPLRWEFLMKKIFDVILYQKNTISSIDYLLPVLVCSGFKNKIKLLFSLLFPSKEFLLRRYGISHTKMTFLYYFIRPLTLIRKGIDAIGHLVWRMINPVYSSLIRDRE